MPEPWRRLTRPDGTPRTWGDVARDELVRGRLSDLGLSIREVRLVKRAFLFKLTLDAVWVGPSTGAPNWHSVLTQGWRGVATAAGNRVDWAPSPAGIAFDGLSCLEDGAARQGYMSKIARALGLGG